MARKVSVYIETYGCSANQSHSENMAGLLRDSGCHVTDAPERAEILVLNTCIVKEPTERKMFRRIGEIRRLYPEKKLIIAGCMPTGEHEILVKEEPDASLMGPKSCSKIAECVEKTLGGSRVEYLDDEEVWKETAGKKRLNSLVGIIEISQGCLGNCAYCIVKNAKGRLISRPMDIIERDIRSSLLSGCREIWLTSQDCGCYGRDIGTKVTEMLKHVTSIKGDFRVRLGMSNPNHIKPELGDFVSLYRDKKLYKFMHIPVQSGSDKVLRDMKRQYVTDDYMLITGSLRSEIPDITIWTDVIIGFPGETKEDFRATMKTIRDTKPDFVNVSKYGNRPGTEAEKMEQLERDVINRRSKEISSLVDRLSLKRNKLWIGKECRVLVTEKGRERNQYIGRNEAYKPVILESEKSLMGRFVTVTIIDAKKTHLKGLAKAI